MTLTIRPVVIGDAAQMARFERIRVHVSDADPRKLEAV